MTRRQFNRLILSAVIAGATSVRGFAARLTPSRFLKALKPQSFPGRLRPLDEAEVRKEGKWAG
jgi:hypothetical protein